MIDFSTFEVIITFDKRRVFSLFKVDVLKKCFDGFADEEGAIPAENVGNILSLMGLKVKPTALKNIIEEIDEDGIYNL